MKATFPAEGNPYNYGHRDELITTKYITEPTYHIATSKQIIGASSSPSPKLVSIGLFQAR
jgi:hypothetical protein